LDLKLSVYRIWIWIGFLNETAGLDLDLKNLNPFISAMRLYRLVHNGDSNSNGLKLIANESIKYSSFRKVRIPATTTKCS